MGVYPRLPPTLLMPSPRLWAPCDVNVWAANGSSRGFLGHNRMRDWARPDFVVLAWLGGLQLQK